MNASDIIKQKQNGILYTAYTVKNNILSNPNTRQNILETYYNTSTQKYTNVPMYSCDNFINYQLQQYVYEGGKICGNHVIQDISGTNINNTIVKPYVCPESNLLFTNGPLIICPNINFTQGTQFINKC
jgi:hypothetical protein